MAKKMKCPCKYNCLRCCLSDCLASDFPLVDLDEYIELYRVGSALIFKYVDLSYIELPEYMPKERVITAVKDIESMMTDDFKDWCSEKNIHPIDERDFSILIRAFQEGFEGKKLEKALYKVRHRDKYLEQKRRYRMRCKVKKSSLIEAMTSPIGDERGQGILLSSQ